MNVNLLFQEAEERLKLERNIIKAELKDTFNRLHSIAFDAKFIVEKIQPNFPDFPLVANLRAGAWYTNSHQTCYFKSTDGHTNECGFNLRRVNLNLIPLISTNDGVVIIDVTRRGKRFPDALSKTIPIWCAVINLVRLKLLSAAPDNSTISKEDWEENGKFSTLFSAVSRSEHSNIEANIDQWAQNLIGSAYDLSVIKSLRKPLRPIFISPASTLVLSTATSHVNFHPIVLVSASKLTEEAEDIERAGGFTYVQGGGDDHELWSRGLTPSLFWKNYDQIMATSRSDLEEVIDDLLESSLSLETLSVSNPSSSSIEIRGTKIALDLQPQRSQISPENFLFISIDLDKSSSILIPSTETSIVLSPKPGKSGYPNFFDSLSSVLENALVFLSTKNGIVVRIFSGNFSSDGIDLGIALTVIILYSFFDSNGIFKADHGVILKATKLDIRARLQWILEVFPSINPSRAILNKVNNYLMSQDH